MPTSCSPSGPLRRPLGILLDAGLLLELPAHQAGPCRRRPCRTGPQLSARHRRSWPTPAPSCGKLLAGLERRAVDGRPRLAPGTSDIAGWRKEWQASSRPASRRMPRRFAPSASSPTVVPCCRTTPSSRSTRASTTTGSCSSGRRAGRRPCSIPGAIPAWASVRAASSAPSSPRPDRPCVSICGDGGFTMVPHVLCTAVEYDIPVVWVVWNNFRLGRDPRSAVCLFRRPRIRHRLLPRPEPRALQSRLRRLGASAAGVDGHTVTRSEDFAGVLQQAVAFQQAVPDRRPCGRQHSPAGHRRLGAAADPPKEPVFGKRWRPDVDS
jgi:acetolactate synthase I/II/III large subunit